MSRSIGGVSFHLFNGRIANLKTRSETWEVFGVDGVGVMLGGYGDGDFQLQTIFFAQNSSFFASAHFAMRRFTGTNRNHCRCVWSFILRLFY